MNALRSRAWAYRDSVVVHLGVGVLACLFVLSPALFTPWGFGPDFTNHLWLVWQQSEAIANTGHPTLYLETAAGILEPFYGFYGGTLYALVGGAVALVGTDHAYSVYIASIGGAIALAYGGMWWLGRLIGLSRWVSHLPAFVVVTGAYYLTDTYARGAWPEVVALSAVPMVGAAGAYLLTRPWRFWPVASFAFATVILTGSHNLTLFWSVVIIAPVAVALFAFAGRSRPSWRRAGGVLMAAALATGVNGWFLLLDLHRSGDVQAWIQGKAFIKSALPYFIYFDNLGNVLDPLRGTPAQSTTPGLAIAPPLVAFALSVALIYLAWPIRDRVAGWVKMTWLVLMAAMAVLVGLLVMPASWWQAIGEPFADIQFPYRLAGWLLIAVAVQLAISLRFARDLSRVRRQIAVILGLAVVAITITQAAAQMYPSGRLDHTLNESGRPRTVAFENGPGEPPATWYDPFSYADGELPVVEAPANRIFLFPHPEPGQTEVSMKVGLPPGNAPIGTNIAAGPYAVKVTGLPIVGRSESGALILGRPRGGNPIRDVKVAADGGTTETVGVVITIICLVSLVALLAWLAVKPRLRRRDADLVTL